MALINHLKVTLISFCHNAICKRLFYLNILKSEQKNHFKIALLLYKPHRSSYRRFVYCPQFFLSS